MENGSCVPKLSVVYSLTLGNRAKAGDFPRLWRDRIYMVGLLSYMYVMFQIVNNVRE
jgi:hypothetical protein